VNIAPFDAGDNPDLVWVPAKNNNGKRSEPLRIRLDPLTLSYSLVEVLDVAEWQAEVRAAQKGHKKSSPVFDDAAIVKLCDPPVTKSELHAAVRGLKVTERDTRAGIDRLLRTGKLVEKKAGDRNRKMIGIPQC
jgi:hypothetical protein